MNARETTISQVNREFREKDWKRKRETKWNGNRIDWNRCHENLWISVRKPLSNERERERGRERERIAKI